MASSDYELLGKMMLKRKQNGSAVANPKPKTPIAKKEKADSDFDDDDEKLIAKIIQRKAPSVNEVKKEEKSSISNPDKNAKRKREDATPEKKKRERKVYDLPGQKRNTPEEFQFGLVTAYSLETQNTEKE